VFRQCFLCFLQHWLQEVPLELQFSVVWIWVFWWIDCVERNELFSRSYLNLSMKFPPHFHLHWKCLNNLKAYILKMTTLSFTKSFWTITSIKSRHKAHRD
jgi:hypothetical protein